MSKRKRGEDNLSICKDLLKASRRGDVERVRGLTERADVNLKNYYGERALSHAASKGYKDIFELLIRSGADTNADKLYLLHDAAQNGHVEVVRVLIRSDVDVNAVNNEEMTALRLAADEGHFDVAKVLIQNGADINEEDKVSLFFDAAENGHAEVMEVLIQNGVDVNAADDLKRSAIHYAADGRHFDVVKLLIQNGADVNVARFGQETALHFASIRGHVRIAKLLLENGAEVNAVVGRNKLTALHIAAKGRHVELVEVLIQNGADVNAVEAYYCKTPLHLAARQIQIRIVEALLENGAEVNAVDDKKWTALHHAAYFGHSDIAKLLIQNGAEVNAVNLCGHTALLLLGEDNTRRAVGYYTILELVAILILNGADVNFVDKNKKSALHLFARGHVDVVKVLILNGANTKQKDVDGLTAFDLAIHYKDLEIATLLIQSVADDKVHTAACAVLAIAADNDYRWRQHYGVFCTLKLVCFGAMKAAGIMSYAEIIKYDRTNLLGKIKDRLDSLRAGNRIESSLMCQEEKRFMWNLAFFFTIKHRAAAFKAFYAIRSFITFHGIFMGYGYGLGNDSLWSGETREKEFFKRITGCENDDELRVVLTGC